MARLSDPELLALLKAAERWRKRCLEQGGSVFSEGRLWTEKNLAVLHEAFFGNLIDDQLSQWLGNVVARDDVNDAFAALWTVERVLANSAIRIPDTNELDSAGAPIDTRA